MSRRFLFALVLQATPLVLLSEDAAVSQSVELLVAPAPVELDRGEMSSRLPSRLAERSALLPDSRLVPAEVGAVDELVAMRRWNAAGRLPRRNGFLRPLSSPRNVRFEGVDSSRTEYQGGALEIDGAGLRFTTRVEVEDAWRLRLRLDDVTLPQGTRMWVWSDDGETVGPFGPELRSPDGTLYTPSVAGPRLTLEVELPRGDRSGIGFHLRELVQLFGSRDWTGDLVPRDSSCLLDAQCVSAPDWPPIRDVQKSLGLLMFGPGFLCSGNLLNNTREDRTPYLLTAHHCISTQHYASSLEVIWDYQTSACGSSRWPEIASLPRSSGSTLLATGQSSDYTLLKLNGLSGERSFLGWDAQGVSHDQKLYRVSHPWPTESSVAYPQVFASYRVDTSIPACGGAPRERFIHMKNLRSASFNGSSGSSSMNQSGQVVGQLTGACGPDPEDGCNFGNTEVDGDFRATFPYLEPWLAPERSGNDYPPCEEDTTVLCIDRAPGDGRFQVTLRYDSSIGGGFSGDSQAVTLNDVGITRGGLFAFKNRTNPELLVKVLDACGPGGNGHFWVFYAATTTVGFELTVIDTVSDRVKIYRNPDLNAALPVADTTAFDTCGS